MTEDFEKKRLVFLIEGLHFNPKPITNLEKRMKLALQAYKDEIKILETSKEKNRQVRIKNEI